MPSSTKPRKAEKTKHTTITPMKDLRPSKDPKASGQKKEGPGINQITAGIT
ncbi:MAG TPA: hypothetical protein VGM62_04125 [Chthoniobacterales bacterium]|jgi:hypothetical protein